MRLRSACVLGVRAAPRRPDMAAAAPRVIVTRPAREATHWVAQLGAHGIQAVALPLIAIGPCTDTAMQQALDAARANIVTYRALMFVSGNAVMHFFEQKRPVALDIQALAATKMRAWAPARAQPARWSRRAYRAAPSTGLRPTRPVRLGGTVAAGGPRCSPATAC